MPTIRPLRNILVIEKEEDEKTSPGGIHLAKIDKDKPRIGKVLAVGPGTYTDDGEFRETGIEVGDRIVYTLAHEKTFEIDHEEFVCVLSSGVLGKLPV
jgi:chaperonin GroES